jgi:phosphomannomutase
MVTGSHNPKDDNGIKITKGNKPFFGNQILALLSEPVLKNTGGSYTNAEHVFEKYINRLVQRHTFKKQLRIAWDAGNGAAGPVVDALCDALPEHFHVKLFTEIDGDFPNHHPDPSQPENLTYLVKAVAKHRCDIGFAFDGDGDRIGAVDSTGRILAGDELVAILATAILKEAPGATMIADVKCSNHTFNAITSAGGKAIMVRTGHSWIKQSMTENNAAFAGEMSGHMFFKHDYYGFDDGLYAAVFLADYVQKLPGSFVDLVAQLPSSYSTPELRLECREEEKFSIVDALKEKLQAAGKEFNAIDGVRVEELHGWWLVRASNTQSALIVRAESNTEDGLRTILDQLKNFGINI